MSDNPDPKTIEFLLDFLRDAPERQIDNAESLDSKMVNIFGAASIVIGLAGFSSGGLPLYNSAVTTLLVMGVLAYAATAYFAFVQLSPQRWRRSIYASFWVRRFWNHSESETRESVLVDLAKSYAENRPRLERVMNLGENRIEMRIPQSAWFPRDLCFPHP
jgi:hypothetical protein